MTISYPPFAYSLYKRPDGLTFAYKVLGKEHLSSRIPLVMVQGLSAVGLVDWLPLADHLAKTRPVLIFDNRGIGSSLIPKEQADQRFTMRDMGLDVIALIKKLGFKEVDLLGYSMGGMIVQSILVEEPINRPFKIKHVLLMATSAKAAHSDLIKAMPKPTEKQLSIEEKKEMIRPFIHVNYDPKFVADPKNKDLLERRITESVMTRRPAKVIAHQMTAIAKYDVRKLLPTLVPASLPVLVIHGREDRSVYFTEHDYILKGIKHAKLGTYQGMGHSWPDYQTPEYWTELINNFCNDGQIDHLLKVGEGVPKARM